MKGSFKAFKGSRKGSRKGSFEGSFKGSFKGSKASFEGLGSRTAPSGSFRYARSRPYSLILMSIGFSDYGVLYGLYQGKGLWKAVL